MRGLRTKRVRPVKDGTLIATVDIGATTNTGYCMTVDGRDIKVFKFGNTKEGFEKFWHMIVVEMSQCQLVPPPCPLNQREIGELMGVDYSTVSVTRRRLRDMLAANDRLKSSSMPWKTP